MVGQHFMPPPATSPAGQPGKEEFGGEALSVRPHLQLTSSLWQKSSLLSAPKSVKRIALMVKFPEGTLGEWGKLKKPLAASQPQPICEDSNCPIRGDSHFAVDLAACTLAVAGQEKAFFPSYLLSFPYLIFQSLTDGRPRKFHHQLV